jgi:hypothetical protein
MSVTMVFTTLTPVNGSAHFFIIFVWRSRVVSSMAFMTRREGR